MGDMADALINGDFDFYTGEYLGRGVGFPRTKMRSISDRQRGKRRRLEQFNDNQKMKGVLFFLHDKGFKNSQAAHVVIREYYLEIGFKLTNKKPIKRACVEIQNDFGKFLNWFKNVYGANNI